MAKRRELRGVCHFYSDFGAGRFAFQDAEHISEGGERWFFEGLHLLEEGDHLTIYSKKDPSKVVWEGTVSQRQLRRINRKTRWARWFLKEYPAKLATRIYKVLRNGKVAENFFPGRYAGWKNGKVFGRLDCKSGKRMKKENRVFFLTWEDAIASGYRPCKKCKPTPEDSY